MEQPGFFPEEDPLATDQLPDGGLRIKIIGVGGAGTNAVDRIKLEDLEQVHLTAIDTDSQVLSASPVEETFLLGRTVTHGKSVVDGPRLSIFDILRENHFVVPLLAYSACVGASHLQRRIQQAPQDRRYFENFVKALGSGGESLQFVLLFGNFPLGFPAPGDVQQAHLNQRLRAAVETRKIYLAVAYLPIHSPETPFECVDALRQTGLDVPQRRHCGIGALPLQVSVPGS